MAIDLRTALARIAESLRAEFSRPAMNQRILHRLATTSEADLVRLGLTPGDIRAAAAPDVADAAAFLMARRASRIGGQSSFCCHPAR